MKDIIVMKIYSIFCAIFLCFALKGFGQIGVTVSSPMNPLGYHLNQYGAATASADANVVNAQGSASYAWSNGGTTQTITGLSAGQYCVTVTDQMGSTASSCIAITQPPMGTCYTPLTTIAVDSCILYSVGNCVLNADTLADGISFIGDFDCNVPSLLYGLQCDMPRTRVAGVELEPKLHATKELLFAQQSGVGGPVMSLQLFGDTIALASVICNVNMGIARIYAGNDSVGQLSFTGGQLIIAGGDSIEEMTIDYDSSGSAWYCTILFADSVIVGTLVGDRLQLQVNSPAVLAWIDSWIYQSSGDVPSFTLRSIYRRATDPTPPAESPVVLPVRATLPTNALDDPFVYVSEAMLNALTDWSHVTDSVLGPTVGAYLQQQSGLNGNEVTLVINALSYPPNPGGLPCRCVPFTIDPALDSPDEVYDVDEGPDVKRRKWQYWYRRVGRGPSYAYHLENWGQGTRSASEYEQPTKFSAMDLIYVCVGPTGLPSYCCNQVVDLRARYDSRQEACVRLEGAVVSRGSRAKAEDFVSLYTYEWTTTQPTVQILNVKGTGVSNAVGTTWNPDFFINATKLAASVASALASDGMSISQLQIDAIKNDIIALLSGSGPVEHHGSQGCRGVDLSFQRDASLILHPNVRRTIRLESRGYLYAGGYGNWRSQADIQSDYLLVVKPRGNNNPTCCLNRSARWDLASCWGTPYPTTELRNSVGAFLYVDRPWKNTATNQWMPADINSGRMVVTTDNGLVLFNLCNPYPLSSINISTARSADGLSLLAPPSLDPHWSLLQVPGQVLTQPVPATVVPPHPQWGQPVTGSKWISNSANGGNSADIGLYTYERSFCLQALDSSLRLEVALFADNFATLILNGDTLFANQWAVTDSIVVLVTDTSKFRVGQNKLQAIVNNTEQAHGLAVYAVVSGAPGLICDPLTAVEPPVAEPLSPEGLRLFPNPVHGRLSIVGLPVSGKADLHVWDQQGRCLLTGEGTDIDVSGLAPGIYLLDVRGKGARQMLRFVKQ